MLHSLASMLISPPRSLGSFTSRVRSWWHDYLMNLIIALVVCVYYLDDCIDTRECGANMGVRCDHLSIVDTKLRSSSLFISSSAGVLVMQCAGGVCVCVCVCRWLLCVLTPASSFCVSALSVAVSCNTCVCGHPHLTSYVLSLRPCTACVCGNPH